MENIEYEMEQLYRDNKAIMPITIESAVIGADGKTTAEHFEELNSTLEYSTNEIPVGKWIDGKTIYRKVLSKNLGNTTGVITVGQVGTINTLVSAKFIIKTSSFQAEGAVYSGTSYQPFNVGYVATDGTVGYKSYVTSYLGGTVTAIVEYTKP